MSDITTTKIDIKELKPNPNNPRTIKDDSFKKLVRSLREFPEMIEAREIVVNTDMVILGGNMRYRAALEAGIKTVPVKIVDWPEDKQREFIIKDNVSGGEWDWEALASEWDADDLERWGLDVPDIANEEPVSKISITEELLSMSYTPSPKDSLDFDEAVYADERFDDLEALVRGLPEGDIKRLCQKRLNDFVGYNFHLIADYYATGASEQEREAMRRLGLVFSTTEEAIRNGFALADDLLEEMNGEA